MTKRLISHLIIVVLAGFLFGLPAGASKPAKAAPVVSIQIDISSQTMAVKVNGWPYGRWRVSTAREGYHTPRGTWRPFLLKKMHYSRKYDNSPMPNSIFSSAVSRSMERDTSILSAAPPRTAASAWPPPTR